MNREELNRTFKQTPRWIANIFDEVEDTAHTFKLLYRDVINDHVKTSTEKVRTNSLPWVIRDIRKLMNKRYKALLKWQKNKQDLQLKMTYKKLRNGVTRQLRITEAAYWKEQFSKAKTSKEFWTVVNKLKRKQKDHRIGPLKDESDNLVTDDTEKAELMNSYFTRVGQKLSEALDSSFDTNNVSYINQITPTCGRLEMKQNRFDGQFKDIKPGKSYGI